MTSAGGVGTDPPFATEFAVGLGPGDAECILMWRLRLTFLSALYEQCGHAYCLPVRTVLFGTPFTSGILSPTDTSASPLGVSLDDSLPSSLSLSPRPVDNIVTKDQIYQTPLPNTKNITLGYSIRFVGDLTQ